MGRMTHVAVAAFVTTGLLTTGMGVPAAHAGTITACVKKKTGEVRIGKKCKKGWKKVTWNQQGAVGPQGATGPIGPQGPATVVKDSTGKTLGRYLGVLPTGFSVLMVLVGDGIYVYLPDGRLLGIGSSSPSFKTADCSGTAYMRASSESQAALATGSAGGPSRVVYRVTKPALGPASAWKYTTTKEVVNQVTYSRNEEGTCAAQDGGSPYNGILVALEATPAPADVPGPLTVG